MYFPANKISYQNLLIKDCLILIFYRQNFNTYKIYANIEIFKKKKKKKKREEEEKEEEEEENGWNYLWNV